MIVDCVECNKPTYKAKYFYERAKGNVFCSKDCFYTNRKNKHKVYKICINCDRQFTIIPAEDRKGSGKYCSKDCQNKYQVGKNAPIYKERVKRNCKQCDKEFELREKQTKVASRNIFCSLDCMYKSRRVKKVRLICQFCGDEFEVFPSAVKHNTAKFCSKLCGYANNTGENHFRFKDASSENEKLRKSPAYKKWRVAVFIRDGRKCVWCGSKKDIEADHIKPFSLFPELALELSNGRTLCHDCHETTPSYMNSHMKREDYE